MKKGFALVVVLIGLVVAAAVLYIPAYLWIFPSFHDQTLNDFSTQFLSTPLPDGTQEIDSLSKVGQQTGNGDHCDYLAALLLQTSLSKSEIERYYSEHYTGKAHLYFYWTNEPHTPGVGAVNPTEIVTLNDWVNTEAKAKSANLIVYLFEGSMTSAFDYRCS